MKSNKSMSLNQKFLGKNSSKFYFTPTRSLSLSLSPSLLHNNHIKKRKKKILILTNNRLSFFFTNNRREIKRERERECVFYNKASNLKVTPKTLN